jgi:hypothetical protein
MTGCRPGQRGLLLQHRMVSPQTESGAQPSEADIEPRFGPVCRVPAYEIGEMAWKSSTVGRMLRSVKNWWIMKIALITVGLLATAVSQASPAFARGTLHLLAPWNSQHVKPDEGTQPACKEHGRHRSGSARKQHISPACPQEQTLLLRVAHERVLSSALTWPTARGWSCSQMRWVSQPDARGCG